MSRSLTDDHMGKAYGGMFHAFLTWAVDGEIHALVASTSREGSAVSTG